MPSPPRQPRYEHSPRTLGMPAPLGPPTLSLALAILAEPDLEEREAGHRDQTEANQDRRQNLTELGDVDGRNDRADHHQQRGRAE